MFLNLNHQKLEISKHSRIFVLECYKITNLFPSDERFILVSQIRRAALSVHLNIAEGASRKSDAERKRFYEIARGSVIEIDAAFDIAYELGYFERANTEILCITLLNCFKMLSGLMKSST
ncbi:MAG TPA: four helix bundle protein [Puia sp.]|nr:four helix bundle protein [Puia sp.]